MALDYYLAERVRFELTVLAYTRVPGVHLKPLGHLSDLGLFRDRCHMTAYPALKKLDYLYHNQHDDNRKIALHRINSG